MIIRDLQSRLDNGWQTVSAEVVWECLDRPVQEIFFRAPVERIKLWRHINSFVMAAAAPAMVAGEKRIKVEEEIDPVVYESLPSALAILRNWCADISRGWSELEIIGPLGALPTPPDRSTAAFYSGGVDATFTVLHNLDLLQPGCIGRIDTALMVYGLDLGYVDDRDDSAAFDLFLRRAAPVLSSWGIKGLPVFTNLRKLDPRPGYWGRVFNGLALSGLAQLFSNDIEQVLISTAGERLSITVQQPFGSHPVLHNYTNSRAVQTRSPYVEYSRVRRIGRILKDGTARTGLRVCFRSTAEQLNCGICEKCVRTRVAIHLLGEDDRVGFGGPGLSPSLIESVAITNPSAQADHEELRDLLLAAGDYLLAAAETKILARWQKYDSWRRGRGFKQRLKKRMLSLVELDS